MKLLKFSRGKIAGIATLRKDFLLQERYDNEELPFDSIEGLISSINPEPQRYLLSQVDIEKLLSFKPDIEMNIDFEQYSFESATIILDDGIVIKVTIMFREYVNEPCAINRDYLCVPYLGEEGRLFLPHLAGYKNIDPSRMISTLRGETGNFNIIERDDSITRISIEIAIRTFEPYCKGTLREVVSDPTYFFIKRNMELNAVTIIDREEARTNPILDGDPMFIISTEKNVELKTGQLVDTFNRI